MLTIASKDIIHTPSYITAPKEITFVEDAKQHIVKSVVSPYSLYEQLRDKIEDELYLIQNAKALSQSSYDEFLEIEAVCEDFNTMNTFSPKAKPWCKEFQRGFAS